MLRRSLKITRTNKFDKVTEYKINIQKSVSFSYISNEGSRNKMKKISSFIITSK